MTDKKLISSCINQFSNGSLSANGLALFSALGYQSTLTFNVPTSIDKVFKFDNEKALKNEWLDAPFLFQLTESNLSNIQSLFTQVDGTIIESYMFVAIELKKSDYSRTQLVTITRELNKKSPQPILILFKHGETLTLSVIHRRLHKRDESKDVLEKVTLLKDIRINDPHRAHIDILSDLAFDNLNLKSGANFVDLHNAWQTVLDTKTLNKQFYKELSQWYFWAMKEVYFPDAENIEAVKGSIFADEDQVREHNAKSLIRLLTRLLFVWFIKEKNLIPEQLFKEDWIKSQLSGFKLTPNANSTFQGDESHYYRAILQNLFFATLNQTCDKRGFRTDGQHRNITNLMRYKSYFSEPDAFLKLVSEIVPFMNGGLFDCLDKPLPDVKGKQGGDVIAYEDGFSDRADNKLKVPDYIFFGSHKNVDLSEELGNKQKSVEIKGLVDILKSYKFTITENTPIEEDIALDPELLGQVFENLLASYNPETKTTARKQTGSFYTPREIVDYMVDESLKAYFKSKLEHLTTEQLDDLLSYTKPTPEFSEQDKTALIEAIDTCKILDPACGSGAFPMGILHKLVFVLSKLDENNERWRELQKTKAVKETQAAFDLGDHKQRENRLKEINDNFDFNATDYGRKLYLIENCIYGVDIQAIAIQISKLRFFISLMVDQKIDNTKTNFGVLPLPNLETKFVAANTLIDIEKPKRGIQADSTISLFDNKDIEALEEKLKKVRHSLFSIRSPSRKRELRDEDKLLREQIGKLLEQHGWGNETAQQLAHWNPYDQNANADFFNLEWMFGLKDGFDIVIGNPPYIGAIALSKDLREILNVSNYYKTLYQKWDIYIAFFERAIRLNVRNGVTCMIIPYPVINQTYAKKLREFIVNENSLLEITNLSGNKIFDSATVTNCILFVKNTDDNKSNEIKLSKLDDAKICVVDYISKSDLVTSDKTSIWNLSKKKSLSFTGDSFRNLGDYCFISIGMVLNADERKAKGLFVKDELLSDSETEIHCRKYVEAKHIEKYQVKKIVFLEWGTERVPSLVRRPTFPELYERPKLLVSKIGKIKATFDDSNICCDQTIRILVLWHDLKNVVNKSIDNSVKRFQTDNRLTLEKNSVGVDLKFLLALINSTLANYLLDQIRGIGNIDINPEYLKKIPIPKILESEQQPFVKLVNYILFIKKQPFYGSTDLDFAEERLMSNFFENLIDALFYELYFPEELHKAKKQFMSLVIQENLPDLNAIEGDKVGALKQIVRRLTDKNHPLYNNLFFLDSVPVVRIIEGKE